MTETNKPQGPTVDVGFADGRERDRNEPPGTRVARRKAEEQVAAGRERAAANAPATVDNATGRVELLTRDG
jgi:hypothetical protein